MTRPGTKSSISAAERSARRRALNLVSHRRTSPICTRSSRHKANRSAPNTPSSRNKSLNISKEAQNKSSAESPGTERGTLGTGSNNIRDVSDVPSSSTLRISLVNVRDPSPTPSLTNITKDNAPNAEPFREVAQVAATDVPEVLTSDPQPGVTTGDHTNEEIGNTESAGIESEREVKWLVEDRYDETEDAGDELSKITVTEVEVHNEALVGSDLPPGHLHSPSPSDWKSEALVLSDNLNQEAVGVVERYLNQHFESNLDTFSTEVEHFGHLASACLFSYYNSITDIKSAHALVGLDDCGLEEIAQRLHVSYKVPYLDPLCLVLI